MSKKNRSPQAAVQSANKTPATENIQSGVFVTVKSKLPFGRSFATPDGKVHVIKGMNQGILVKTEGLLGQYATTRLNKDAWDYFTKVYAEDDCLKNKVIFADVKAKNAAAQAKEIEKDVKTGMEQINPDNVPNIKTSDNEQDGTGVVA